MAAMDDRRQMLREDGYLNVDRETSSIICHPNLNVILLFLKNGEVKVLDINSGVILQSCGPSSDSSKAIKGKYLSVQDKVLLWNNRNIGLRGDYNGVLLLDTILQTPVVQTEDTIKLELLLCEAILFLQCLQNLEENGLENTADVSNELTFKISEAQANVKRGIKAQKWNTICLELPRSSLKVVAYNVMYQLRRLERHIPALAIASAINERLTDLLLGGRFLDPETTGNAQKLQMFSEAARRQTFEAWPHMDYKWALPDQMAQAGFYHYPSVTGDDRAMCFTCSVCLVCWEKTDEPWSEHERHSPACPFVKGEYTQNVPLSITYATNPAIPTPGFEHISNGDLSTIVCTGTANEVTVWNVERQIKKTHSFVVSLDEIAISANTALMFARKVNPTVKLQALCTYKQEKTVQNAQMKAMSSVLSPSPIAGGVEGGGGGSVGAGGGGGRNNSGGTCILTKSVSGGSTTNVPNAAANAKNKSRLKINKMIGTKIVCGVSIDSATECLIVYEVFENADAYFMNNTCNGPAQGNVTVADGATQNESSAQQNDSNKDGKTSSLKVLNDDRIQDVFMTYLPSDIDIKLYDPWKNSDSDKIDMFLCQDFDYSFDSMVQSKPLTSGVGGTTSSVQKKTFFNDTNENTATAPANETTQPKMSTSNDQVATVAVQFIPVLANSCLQITDIHLTYSQNYILVVLKPIPQCDDKNIDVEMTEADNTDELSTEMPPSACLMLYAIGENGRLNEVPAATRTLSKAESPREISMLPSMEFNGQCPKRLRSGLNTEHDAFVITCDDGSIKLIAAPSLRTLSEISIAKKFVSATYCKSLERLCGCTESGSLHFYSFYELDGDSEDEREEEFPSFNTLVNEVPSRNDENLSETDGPVFNATPMTGCNNVTPNTAPDNHYVPIQAQDFLANKSDLSVIDLKMMYSMTLFDEMLTPYVAEVPGCWSDLVQAQKQRRHPQHLNPGDDTHLTKTWRLHNDATTWDEHIIELSLHRTTSLGHIDLKFSLYQPCPNPPAIQVTLLKQNSSGFGYRMKAPHCIQENSASVDENIDFNLGSLDSKTAIENPVLSDEYLQTHNAEILAGPIDLSSSMDLSDQGGLVTLTSPKLLRTKSKNFLVHIKTMADLSRDGQGKTRVPVKKKGILQYLYPSFTKKPAMTKNISNQNDSAKSNSIKNDYYIGCDWLHEISITVRSTQPVFKVPNERQQRIAMVESKILLDNLLTISCSSDSLRQNLALDILIWIASIRMVRFRSPKTDPNKLFSSNLKHNYDGKMSGSNQPQTNECSSVDVYALQKEFVGAIETKLSELIRKCIVLANRSIAHKCVKLILIISDGAQNMLREPGSTVPPFDEHLKNAMVGSLPELVEFKNAGALKWFTTLISGTATVDSQAQIGEGCLKLLLMVANEIEKRRNPYNLLLRTRFGLYGMPFETELFDAKLPVNIKNNALLIKFASLTKTNSSNSMPQQNQGIDLKTLCSSEGSDKSLPPQFRRRCIDSQLKGILEVEQLHFICSSASEATRLENIDTVSTNQSFVIDELIFETPTQNNVNESQPPELKKKSDIDKDSDDIMNNVKNLLAQKMENFKKNFLSKETESSESHESANLNNGNEQNWLFTNSNDAKIENSSKSFDAVIANENFDENNSTMKSLSNKIGEFLADNKADKNNCILPWHRLLNFPPKQMIVVDRMHSGARRFVTLDFGAPVLLTDLIIPACEDLVSLYIDIWCFEEETDSIRLVVSPDIGLKTLVLSDLQPPPICRFMKITITGRYGMSVTRCKIPIGYFFGHFVVLDKDAYADPVLQYVKAKSSNIPNQLKALNALLEDVQCRYSLASSKLTDLLDPLLNSDTSNVAHMQAFFNKKENENYSTDNSKIVTVYEDCMLFQHQLNVIKNVIQRLESLAYGDNMPTPQSSQTDKSLSSICSDKLIVMSEEIVEILLHFLVEFGTKNVNSLHSFFNPNTCNIIFNTLVVYGDPHLKLATCTLLVRMCCFQSWWGDFLANTFSKLFSAQNSKIFPQDRVFFLLTYLGRRSIAMGRCRSIVIDAILKTLAKLLAPLSPQFAYENATSENQDFIYDSCIWSTTDLQLVGWLLLFLSACLDDEADKKDQASVRWDFMAGEADISKSRPNSGGSGRSFSRSFKKRLFQNKPSNASNLAEKFYMMQAGTVHVANFASQIELAIKQQENYIKKASQLGCKLTDYYIDMNLSKQTKPVKIPRTPTMIGSSSKPALTIDPPDHLFDKGLKSLKPANTLIVIRGLIGLLLGMDFSCSMDLFLLTCKVIARLVSACRSSIQLSKIMTTSQLQHLIRLAVWEYQQQPWAVHAITCLLQDILEADKNFRQLHGSTDGLMSNNEFAAMDSVDIEDLESTAENVFAEQIIPNQPRLVLDHHIMKDVSYADAVKQQLPSLMECDDAEMEDFLDDFLERSNNLSKKDNSLRNGIALTLSVSSAMDARLECGLETNVEIRVRRLALLSSFNLFANLPPLTSIEQSASTVEQPTWPDYIVRAWSGPEYNQGLTTNLMLMIVFDNIFSDLHLQDSWLNLEQVLQLWLTLNGELSDKVSATGFNPGDIPKIPFGRNAVQGLLSALSWHPGIKLRAWCLGFQCLTLACNPHLNFELTSADNQDDLNENYSHRMGVFIVNSTNFEKMLLRFFSGVDMPPNTLDNNRCAGPTICKLLHELFIWMEIKSDLTDMSYVKKKLKEVLLKIVLHLVQPFGAIANQQGPIDAQSQLIKELITFQYDKQDLGVAMSIIESVSYLVFNNISNSEKVYCQKTTDTNQSHNVLGSLFATVLGPESARQNKTVADNPLFVQLLKLSAVLIQTVLPRRSDEPMATNDVQDQSESQTDEIKAKQQYNDNRVKIPCVADTVLQHYPTMQRLLGSLSHCSSSSFALLAASSMFNLNNVDNNNGFIEPQTVGDAVFQLLILLSQKATQPSLVVKPLYDVLNSTSSLRHALPKLQLSEPFIWFILKVLELRATVAIFTEMGGIKVLCQSLVRSNRTLINMQPSLVSMIMQYMNKFPSVQSSSSASSSSNISKKPGNSSCKSQDGLINFASFCSISSEKSTAQPADVLIQGPVASHRRARAPAWSYLFYPNETHVDLTITLPAAILLCEIQLQPHLPSLATCPSAVAVEITRDNSLGPIPISQPMSTVGMTCIRLKFAQPEIATSIVLRLYRPRDSSNIGLTQISIMGTTTFSDANKLNGLNCESLNEDDLAKSSLGWLRILARCFSVATFNSDSVLANAVITAAAEYPGFLEACCLLLNVVPMTSNSALQNLETVLLKMGLHSKEMGLKLIDNLLRNTVPQIFRLCNESASGLLYDLCTTVDDFTRDRVAAMIEWMQSLFNSSRRQGTLQQKTNPYSGFVKCLASILWTAYSTNLIPDLVGMITKEFFESIFQWTLVLESGEPLKKAIDAMLCSICCIKPELFPLLLKKMAILVVNPDIDETNAAYDRKENESMTDDTKQEESNASEWYNHLVLEDIAKISLSSSELKSLALAAQSPLAVHQLLDSGLPRLLTSVILEFCYKIAATINSKKESETMMASGGLTDADKVVNSQRVNIYLTQNYPMVNINTVAEILEFFSELCNEGQMRDWLGSFEGSVFWKPLLDLLCNTRPIDIGKQMEPNFTPLEGSMIKFLSKVTACHPSNQDALTIILISVIRQPKFYTNSRTPANSSAQSYTKYSISGFTRRLVLQLLLESECILVSVRSDIPLQRKDQNNFFISQHPARQPNAHHQLFQLNTHTKCQDILNSCSSEYNNILPSIPVEFRQPELIPTSNTNYLDVSKECRKDLLDIVAAGVTAKDKRLKEVKNQAAALKKEFFPFLKIKTESTMQSPHQSWNCPQLVHPSCPDVILSSDATMSQILAMLQASEISLSAPCITLDLIQSKKSIDDITDEIPHLKAADFEPLASPLQIFSSRGGLSLLAHYLPTVFPESPKASSPAPSEKDRSPPVGEWVKVEANDDIYEDLDDSLAEKSSKTPAISSVPQHSLAAFGLFLRLPAYSDVLLRDKTKAQCLLRLVLGVTGDGEGNEIYDLDLASSLPTLPFEVFRQLLDSSPLTTDDGVLLRRMVIEVGAIHLVLNCLGIFTHHTSNYQMPGPQSEMAGQPSSGMPAKAGSNGASGAAATGGVAASEDQPISDDKSHVYWAKGTGFGTGSTQQSWNVEQALLRQKSEEEHVTVLLQVLSSYINPGDKIPASDNPEEIHYRETIDVMADLPPLFMDLLQRSCLITALSSYLRNDSVLDITRHIPLYRAILQLLRALALSNQLVSLLMPQEIENASISIASLLLNMKTCVDTYASRLKLNKKTNLKNPTKKNLPTIDDSDDEGLALLIPDIQETTVLVQKATNVDAMQRNNSEERILSVDKNLVCSIEQRYLAVMKRMQFDTHEMIVESDNGFRFVVSHHFENNVRMAGDQGHPARVKRLAQETVTLSTSLPLSYSSSVFVRCDNDRLDIMKVLITGPADTPYANGCFEFDVYFPPDYPNSPMMINLETTGRHTIRFNPNLYNDGKVCLSVLNTWHGRPEEKWNAQTSSFLQVLVSIQSLILVPEPYFNEPGFERSRGTPSGTHSSKEYNSTIYQACVKWAMLEQIKNPSPCFKDVIHTHFWLKRHEICKQIEGWMAELSRPHFSERSGRTISFNSMVLGRQYRQLCEELAKLPIPEGLEDLDCPFNVTVTNSNLQSELPSQEKAIQTTTTTTITTTAMVAAMTTTTMTTTTTTTMTTAMTSTLTSTMTSTSTAQTPPTTGTTTATTTTTQSSSLCATDDSFGDIYEVSTLSDATNIDLDSSDPLTIAIDEML